MMLRTIQNEKDFLNSDIYASFRSLICSERIFLSNVYFRFNELDLRELMAGCLVCNWNEDEQMFIPDQNLFNQMLLEAGALGFERPNSIQEFKQAVLNLRPNLDLLIAQQGALVNGQKLYTDMCIFYDGHKYFVSIIREGLEGFNFDLTQQNYDAYELAFDKDIKIVRREKLEEFFKNKNLFFEKLKTAHNKSVDQNLLEIKKRMQEHVAKNISINISNPELLPTFLALKLCGPICWYFNRFIQSCLGLHYMYSCFQPKQLELIEEINLLSSKTRNMGLKLSRSQKDKDRIALEKLIYDLINQIESLGSLSISQSIVRI